MLKHGIKIYGYIGAICNIPSSMCVNEYKMNAYTKKGVEGPVAAQFENGTHIRYRYQCWRKCAKAAKPKTKQKDENKIKMKRVEEEGQQKVQTSNIHVI